MLHGAGSLEGLNRARLPSLCTLSKPSAHSSNMFHRRRRTLLSRRPWLVDLLPRALANQLEIYNDCERIIISDIFIVRDWEHGQPLTIIRRFFLNDVVDV